jgi:hypothetical protein
MKRKCVQMLLVILSIFLFSTGFAQNDSRYHDQYHSGHAIGLDRSVNADTGDKTENQNVYIDGDPVIIRYY